VTIYVVDMRKLRAMDRDKLVRRCADLSKLWAEKGMPPEPEMPRWMVIARAALQSELDRRGEQLSLF